MKTIEKVKTNDPQLRKDLKRLSRAELLELLLLQSKEIEKMQAELEEARKNASSREIRIAKSGSIAEAAVAIYELLETTQKAADEYLYNIKKLSEEESLLSAS